MTRGLLDEIRDRGWIWYPCENPEKPNNSYMDWHDACRGCHVAALASQRRWPTIGLFDWIIAKTDPGAFHPSEAPKP